MGGTGSEDIKITQADVMSQLQRAFLDQFIRGIQGSMGGGFNFGEAYPGPFESGYTNMPFNLGGDFSGYAYPGWDSSDNEYNHQWEEEADDIDRAKRGIKGGKGRGPGEDDPPAIPASMGVATRGANPLTTFLASLPMMNPFGVNNSFPQFSGNTPAHTSAAEEALTSPFANAMTQNLTGNFPKAGA